MQSTDGTKLTRRNLFKSAALVGGVLASGEHAMAAPVLAGAPRRERAKNVIFLVSDGMSMGTPRMAEALSRLVQERGTQWASLSMDPAVARGWFDMQSLNSLVTDSAAASSSWGSGSRIFNGAINMLPDGTKLTPIAHVVRDAGRRVGLVTTTRITHATPAGFASAVPSRDDEDDIASQYFDVVDVLMGGGKPHFQADRRADKADLIGKYGQGGYTVCQSREELASAGAPPRLLGLFWDDHLPFTIDRDNNPSVAKVVPTLAEMTKAALAMLNGAPKGFLLQIEGGRVDHAAHSDDAAALLWDQLAFDDAIAAVREFVRGRDDTLVVITTDHGNANPGLNGMGGGYKDTNECFARVVGAKASYSVLEWRLQGALKESGSPVGTVIDLVHEVMGLDIPKDHAEVIVKAMRDEMPMELSSQLANKGGMLGQILGNKTGIGWTGTSHTADWAPILAFGPGQGRFGQLINNTSAFGHMLALMDIEFENPRMTAEQARRYLSAAPRVREIHWA